MHSDVQKVLQELHLDIWILSIYYLETFALSEQSCLWPVGKIFVQAYQQIVQKEL